MSLARVVYLSRPSSAMGEASMQRILGSSRINNRRQDITGVLAYTRDRFFQVLEGDSDTLTRLVARIRHDSRHQDLQVVQCVAVHRRLFGEWSMALLHAFEDSQALDRLAGQLQDEALCEHLLVRLRDQVNDAAYV